jgi:uncharacterized zinc-type alcohol dehydrogenase-like protein
MSTVNVKLDWNAYVAALKPKGRLDFVGATLEPLDLAVFPLIAGQRSISGTPVGSPATIRRMLDFAARHGINPVTEHFPLDRVNDAIAHLRSGQARYRAVLNRPIAPGSRCPEIAGPRGNRTQCAPPLNPRS